VQAALQKQVAAQVGWSKVGGARQSPPGRKEECTSVRAAFLCTQTHAEQAPLPPGRAPKPQYRPARQRRFLRAHKKPGTQAHRLSPHTGPPPRMLSRLSITAPYPTPAALGQGACRRRPRRRRRPRAACTTPPRTRPAPQHHPCCLRGRAAPQPLMQSLQVTHLSARCGAVRAALSALAAQPARPRAALSPQADHCRLGRPGGGEQAPEPPVRPLPSTPELAQPRARAPRRRACMRALIPRARPRPSCRRRRQPRAAGPRPGPAGQQQGVTATAASCPYVQVNAMESTVCAAGPWVPAQTQFQQTPAAQCSCAQLVHDRSQQLCWKRTRRPAGRFASGRTRTRRRPNGLSVQQQIAAASRASTIPPSHPCTTKGCERL
jgi:hypothetical protein